ncbi:MAG: hypothetical protein ACRC2T_00565 [Thermoguttaceae bacterium]
MAAKKTDFHAPPKPDSEFEIIPVDASMSAEADICCHCTQENYCQNEPLGNAKYVSYEEGRFVAYWFGK